MPHINDAFLQAAANMEQALANALNACTDGDASAADIARCLTLITKKEIVLQFLLETIAENGDVMTECICRGTVNATIPNTTIIVNGVADVGDVTFTGQVCPNCFVEGSALTFTFLDDTPIPTNNSFTLVSTSISAPSCLITPTTTNLNFSGLGVVTRADMSTVNVSFGGQLNETTVPAGSPDTFFISINSQEVGNPFTASYFSPIVPDTAIVVEEC